MDTAISGRGANDGRHGPKNGPSYEPVDLLRVRLSRHLASGGHHLESWRMDAAYGAAPEPSVFRMRRERPAKGFDLRRVSLAGRARGTRKRQQTFHDDHRGAQNV
jgi:hypothetical protein